MNFYSDTYLKHKNIKFFLKPKQLITKNVSTVEIFDKIGTLYSTTQEHITRQVRNTLFDNSGTYFYYCSIET